MPRTLIEKNAEAIPLENVTQFYLLNHSLLHRAEPRSIVAVAGTVCGLHSQLSLTPCFSLWNRIEDFEPELLNDALYRGRSLVKTWAMRGTLHVIPSQDLSIYHHALERMWFEHHGRYMNSHGWPSREDREKLIYPKILEALAKGPLRRKDLAEKVRLLLGEEFQSCDRLFSAWGGILKETNYLGLTVHAEPLGKESCFARLDQWLSLANIDKMDEAQARKRLLLNYLHCYGPASAQDFACWSGLLTSEASKAIEESLAYLKAVQIPDITKRLWMLRKDFDGLKRIDSEEKGRPLLLPKFDSYLLGHKDRTRIIDEKNLRQVYRPVVGDVAATLLVDGRIKGVWTHKKTAKKLTIAVRLLEKVERETLKEVEHVAEQLGDFMGAEQTRLLFHN